jgi:hypothetical protein
MDENRPTYRLEAPGATTGATSYELPAYRDAPRQRRRLRVDEHQIRPEVERREIIDGEVLQAFPAEFEHAVQNADLDYVLRAHLAPGYRVATDLVTRHDVKNDFASDSAVVRDGTDPATGSRHREELAFEVVSKQTKASVTRKAPTMLARGVERVFAVFVEKGQVAEWVPDAGLKAKGRWVKLAADSEISHPSLAKAMSVGSILDAAAIDDTVAQALAAKGNAVIREIRVQEKAAGKIEGKIEGKAESILTVLAGRGLDTGAAVHRRILGTTDAATLERWLFLAGTVSSAAELIKD